MQSSISAVSPLRQRMVEDMRMRSLAPKTQTAYIRAVRKFAKFLGHSPDTATDEDLRRFQLDMVDSDRQPLVGKYFTGRELKDGRSVTIEITDKFDASIGAYSRILSRCRFRGRSNDNARL